MYKRERAREREPKKEREGGEKRKTSSGPSSLLTVPIVFFFRLSECERERDSAR